MQVPLPDGWTQAQYEWLNALGQAKDPAPLLLQNRDWQQAAWVRERLDALRGRSPADLRRLLPAARGLVVIADRTGDVDTRCYARERLLQMHDALYDLNDIAPTMRSLEALLPSTSLPRQVNGGRVLASLYRSMGEYERALRQARAAHAAAIKLADAKLRSQCEYLLATLHYLQGELDAGVRMIQSARQYAQRASVTVSVADCWLFEGVLRRARGEYDLALQAYRNAEPLYEQANFPLGVARCIANRGLVYWTMGLYEDARLHYREAMPRFQQLGSEWDVATCTLNTAILLQHDGDIEGALELYRDALRRYETLGDREGVAYCIQNMADAENQARRYAQAAQYAHRAAALFEQSSNLPAAAHARQVKAQALLAQNRPREAYQTLLAAREGIQANPLRAIAYAYLEGEVHARLGRPQEAARAFRNCLQQIQRLDSLRDAPPEEVGQYLSQFREMVALIVGYHGGRGDWRAAFEACQRGKGNALRLAWQAPRTYTELRPAEQQRLNTLRQRYENALTHQSRAKTPVEQRRLRRETERHLTAWRNYQRELAARYPRLRWRQPEPLAPEQLPLDSETLLMEYAVASDRLTIVWARRQGGRVRVGGSVQRVAEETLRGTIRNLLANMEREAPLETVHKDARQLYDWLVRPLAAQLSGVKRVIICPDGDLHAVPWAVLRDPAGRYFLERVAIVNCPSASAWAAAERMARGKGTPQGVLTVAVSEFRGAEGDTRAQLSPLPGAEREAQAVQRIWGHKARTLRNLQATRAAVLQGIPRANVLHFATHALPNLRMPMLSALALWDGDSLQWLYAHEILQNRLNARLAVLSACRTGIGAHTADGALGLHWAFLAAGCPSVLATLWRLPDDAAPVWAETFYARYKADDSATDALRRACLLLRQNPRFAHPRYWGAWQAFGAQ
ncbi:MAG: CHAT domain-containing protein [Fimbriimonadales bacterium]|nr:CHAT domain-containing protein [Fimbriimonadales bacterium]